MCKWLLSILFICCMMTGCTKSDSGLVAYKAQAAKDDQIVQEYIKANGLTDVAHKVSDTCGVYYIVKNPGVGANIYTSSTLVTVGDTAKLLTTGEVFYQTSNFHPSYQLGSVILGWYLGIPKVQKGGIVRLLVPSRYAYGPYPQKDYNLPANAILDFDIQVYNITN